MKPFLFHAVIRKGNWCSSPECHTNLNRFIGITNFFKTRSILHRTISLVTMSACCCCHATSTKPSSNKVSPDPDDDLDALAKHGIPLQAADLTKLQYTMGQESFEVRNFITPVSAENTEKKTSQDCSRYHTAAKEEATDDLKGENPSTKPPDQPVKNGEMSSEQSPTVQVHVVTTETFRESLAHDLNISGMKQICGGSINCCRRFIWMLVLALMCTLLWLNISSRVAYFNSNPTGLRTETVYQPRIKFPAVTICNMNQVRATGAYRLNQKDVFPYRRNLVTMYEAITHFYDTLDYYDEQVVEAYLDKYWSIWEECYDKDCQTPLDIPSHNKEDLIHECEWRGRSCFPDNFTLVITDMGTCYKWNGGEDGKYIHHAESAGAAGGLRLVLNIEQYEYMRSQKEVAGAYGLVADQREASAEMAGLGFSISKGTYTSVALVRTSFKDLPDPFTNCQEGDSMSLCLLKCVSDYIIEQCGCKEYYMIGDFPSLRNYTDYCGTCRPACSRTRYDTMVSQSPISDFYAKRNAKDVLSDTDVKTEYQEATRQQDWALLYISNNSYTDLVFEISDHLTYVYKHTVQQPFVVLANITELLLDVENTGGGDQHKLDQVKTNVSDLWIVYFNLSLFTRHQYLYNYMLNDYRRGEELNVRVACDIQIGTGYTEQYAEQVEQFMISANNSLQATQVAWDAFILEIQETTICGTRNRITNWNDTMYANMAALQWHIEEALNELMVATDLFDSNADIIQNDPTIKDRTISSQDVYDKEFYLQNFARVDIFYEELSYTDNEQYPSYDFPALVCDLGGNLGLYLGGSLLTVVELIDIVFISICTCCGCCRCRKRRQRRQRVVTAD